MAFSSSLSGLSLSLLLVFCLSSGFAARAKAADIGIYWGFPESNTTLTNLNNTCNTGNFKTVSLAAISNFGHGKVPRADFGSSCDVASGGCKRLQYDIAHCQKMGIKVLVTVGGPTENYTLANPQEAYRLAAHVYDVYLSGYGVDGPLGKVKLDGVDFYLRDSISATDRLYLEIAAQTIKSYDATLILTTSLQCDYKPSPAMETGLFDRVSPRFYDHPCLFAANNTAPFESAVRVWTSALDAAFYVGLPTRPDYPGRSGYILVKELPDALQTPQESCKYAGVMLWNRNWDVRNDNYSTEIKPIVEASPANPCPPSLVVSI